MKPRREPSLSILAGAPSGHLRCAWSRLFYSLFGVLALLAGEASSLPQLVRSQQLLESDGLPSAEVNAMDVSPTGHIAFATRAGIGVFDGSHWVRHTRETGFPFTAGVGALAFDERGRLWAASERLSLGVAVLNPSGWQLFSLPLNEDPSWVRDMAVVRVEGQTMVAILSQSRSLLVFPEGGAATWVADESGAVIDDITCLARSGNSLLAVRPTGLMEVDLGGPSLSALLSAPLPAGELVGASFEGERLWVLSTTWVGYLKGGEFVLHTDDLVELEQGLRYRYSVLGDGSGGVYFGGSLFLMHAAAGESSPKRIAGGRMPGAGGVTDLELDREGGVWVSSLRGVNRFPRQCFESFDARQDLLDDEVTAILETSPGELVLGQVRGVTTFDGVARGSTLLPGAEDVGSERIRVLDLHASSDGGYWVAGCAAGAAKFDADGGMQLFELSELGQCNSVLEDLDGTTWAAGGTGLFRLDPATRGAERVLLPSPRLVEYSARPQPLSADRFTGRRLYQGPSGSLYLTTLAYGTYRWERRGGQLEELPTKFISEEIEGANSSYSVLELSDGRVLVTTRAGLFELEGGRMQRAPQAAWLDEPCYSLLEDDRGRLWVGTGSGLERWEADGSGHRHFGLNDGLSGLESNRSAALQDSLGRIWFGTDRGLSRYREELDQLRVPLVIASVLARAGDQDSMGDELPAHSDVEFEFTLVHFDRDQAEVRSRLLGYEEEWSTARPIGERFVRYTNLPSGEYRLELQARRGGDAWGPSSFSKDFLVQVPIYLRSWFLALCFAALITLVAGVGTLRGLRRLTSRLSVEIERSGAELEASERRYSDMFNRTSAVQVVLDSLTWRVQLANPAACRYFELSGSEILGRDFSQLTGLPREALTQQAELLHTEEREVVLNPAEQGLPHLRDIELRLCRYELRGSLVVQVTVQDISERLALEERLREAQKLRAVGELASGVAHDFNNLLTAILGFSELALLDAPGNEDVARQVEGIIEAAERGADLVRQLLVYGGRQRLRLDDFELAPLVEKHADIFRRLFDRDIEVVCQCGPQVGRIHADRGNIARTLMNLGMNARDAMPEGGRLTLRAMAGTWSGASSGGRTGDYVALQVEDTGIGMDEETRQRMFEPFFTRKEQGKGTGLGLATVQAVVAQSGGEILVKSAPGAGTRIELRFPVVDSAARGALQGEAGHPQPRPRVRAAKQRILVVDDKTDVREGVAAILSTLGHDVATAESGERALEQLQESPAEPFDALLTDVLMPGMSGPELAELVRGRFPGLAVLFMTGYDDQRVLLDQEVVLQKPFTASRLAGAIQEALDRASA